MAPAKSATGSRHPPSCDAPRRPSAPAAAIGMRRERLRTHATSWQRHRDLEWPLLGGRGRRQHDDMRGDLSRSFASQPISSRLVPRPALLLLLIPRIWIPSECGESGIRSFEKLLAVNSLFHRTLRALLCFPFLHQIYRSASVLDYARYVRLSCISKWILHKCAVT